MEQEEKHTSKAGDNVNNIELDDFLRWYGELSIQLKQSREFLKLLDGSACKENAELKSQLMARNKR